LLNPFKGSRQSYNSRIEKAKFGDIDKPGRVKPGLSATVYGPAVLKQRLKISAGGEKIKL